MEFIKEIKTNDSGLYYASLYNNNLGDDAWHINVSKFPGSTNDVRMSVPVVLKAEIDYTKGLAYFYDFYTGKSLIGAKSGSYYPRSKLSYTEFRPMTVDELISFHDFFVLSINEGHIEEYAEKLDLLEELTRTKYEKYIKTRDLLHDKFSTLERKQRY